jgi:hypothetical protein
MRTFTSRSKHSINFNWMLEEEQACNLHSFDGRDLSVELEKLCMHADGV